MRGVEMGGRTYVRDEGGCELFLLELLPVDAAEPGVGFDVHDALAVGAAAETFARVALHELENSQSK